MAVNQTAVQTDVFKQSGTEIQDISRVVALISDTATVTDTYALYTSESSIETAGYATSSDFYKMGEAFFSNGGGYLYGVPLADTSGDADITAKLAELENISDAGFSFGGVLMDSTIRVADQVSDDTLANYALKKPYHIMIESDDVTIYTATTTSTLDEIHSYYESLSGEDANRIGNISGFFTDVADDFIASAAMGIMVGKTIGSQTLKFKTPTGSETAKNASGGELTNEELTFVLNKDINVYSGTNERAGKAFLKEGTTLKSGDYVDTSFGAIWIEVNLDSNIYDLLQENGKVPISQAGYALIEEKINPIFELGITNGVIDGEAETPYSISFSGNKSTRTINVTYTYVDNVAGHFIKNTVTVTQE